MSILRTWVRELQNGTKNILRIPSSSKQDRTLFISGRNSITIRRKGAWKTNPGVVNVFYCALSVHNDTFFMEAARSRDFGKTREQLWRDCLARCMDLNIGI